MHFFTTFPLFLYKKKKTILKFASGFWIYLAKKENTFLTKWFDFFQHNFSLFLICIASLQSNNFYSKQIETISAY